MNRENTHSPSVSSRRDFLKVSSIFLASGILSNAHAAFTKAEIEKLFATKSKSQAKKLHLYSVNSKKTLNIEFFENGKFIKEGLQEIYRLMGDRRTGEIAKIDTDLITSMYELQTKLNTSKPLDVLSGFRSPETNTQMAKTSKHVAKDSYHTHGQAVDLSVRGISINEIHNITQNIHSGGIGYYPTSGFIHIDVGPVRHWKG